MGIQHLASFPRPARSFEGLEMRKSCQEPAADSRDDTRGGALMPEESGSTHGRGSTGWKAPTSSKRNHCQSCARYMFCSSIHLMYTCIVFKFFKCMEYILVGQAKVGAGAGEPRPTLKPSQSRLLLLGCRSCPDRH